MRALLRLAFVVTIVIWVTALSVGRADSAIGLQSPGGGEGVWFYRACRDGENQDVARWTVELDRWSGQQGLLARLSNSYPGYHLQCELYLANTGRVPLAISHVSIGNAFPLALAVTVVPAPGETNRVLKPCPTRPAWGTAPALVPANCRTRVNLSVLVTDAAREGRSYGYGVAVYLKTVLGGR